MGHSCISVRLFCQFCKLGEGREGNWMSEEALQPPYLSMREDFSYSAENLIDYKIKVYNIARLGSL